ncbi:MAG: cytidylate kinase-like family protein [Chloroflexi bacterium]|nr:cytidylate kinase-like family protein [Chloroflexota bacterium]
MAVITIGGQVGAGADQLGAEVATRLGYDYVERFALQLVAKEVRATTQAVWMKENHLCTWRERLGGALARMLEYMGTYGTVDEAMGYSPMLRDPYYGLPADRRPEMRPVRESPHQIPDGEHADAVQLVNARLAETNALVLVERGGCLTLRTRANAIHVGLFAPRDHRVVSLARRMSVGPLEASEFLEARESHRSRYFNRVAGTDPDDRSLYDVVIQTDRIDRKEMVNQVLEAMPHNESDFRQEHHPFGISEIQQINLN